MKRGFLLFVLFILAEMSNAQQPHTYQQQWKEIDTLILIKGLPKSALVKVKALYTDAKNKNLNDQVIKALLYRLSLEAQVTEEDPNINDSLIKAEIKTAKNEVQRSIWYTLLAHAYKQYFAAHAWQLYGRSKTIDFKKDDIATWSSDDFTRQIAVLYKQALQPAKALQQMPLDAYKAIIIKGNTKDLRPTLYDLIAHRALDHFKNENNYIIRPAYGFTIKDPEALATVPIFLQHRFVSEDSVSNIITALQLFQDLIKFHQADKDPAALIDIDLERIAWVYDKAIIINKEKLYKAALENVTATYSDHTGAAQAWYLLAKFYTDKAAGFKPFGDTTNRYAYVQAKEIIDTRLKKDTSASEGRSNMQQLLKQLLMIELRTQVENINVPGQPFRMLVNYRNMEHLYVRVINAAELNKVVIERWDENYWKQLAAVKYISQTIQALPATNDYQQHAVEIKTEALPPGSYAVLAASSSAFDPAKDKMILQRFDVSNISYIKNQKDYFVLHRETGEPLKNVTVRYSKETYDNKKNKYIKGRQVAVATDEHSMFRLPKEVSLDSRGHLFLNFTYGKDTLEIRSNDYYRPYINFEEDDFSSQQNTQVFFFTDRSIYRPGQTVFFKGIAITRNKKSGTPVIVDAASSMTVALKDVNNRLIDSLNLTVNEFGSFTGSFKLPQNTLTGNFSISSGNSITNFSVEEYKRPKFYVTFDTLQTAYQLNDTITVTGFAKAYAGNNIDNAEVTFNVQRTTRFPYPWMFSRMIQPMSNPQQIANGILKTDSTGKFEIRFPALPDEGIDTASDPVFNFDVTASVTDISGETREHNTHISIGYKSLQLLVEVPEKAALDSFKSIAISTKNLSGQDIPSAVNLTITALEAPGKIYRERLWERPDQFSLPKAVFEQTFPYDLYQDEDKPATWPKKEVVVAQTFHTEDNTNFTLPSTNFKAGWYAIEATAKDKDSNTVKNIRYVQLYDAGTDALPSKQTNWTTPVATTIQPGEKTSLLIGSGYDIHCIVNTNRRDDAQQDSSYYDFIQINNQKKLYTVSSTEKDRKGLGIWYAFVKHNRFYTGGNTITMPYNDKDVQVDYTTYRDKTKPGAEEQWSVTVKGNNKEKTTAELLSVLYDASLDQFQPHNWYRPDIWQIGYSINNWQARECFVILGSEENYIPENETGYFEKLYDELAVSGEDFWQRNGDLAIRLSGRISGAAADMSVQNFAVPRAPKALAAAAPALETEMAQDKKMSAAGAAPDTMATSSIENKKEVPFQTRKNFNETAFFFPQLHADADGNYTFRFTMPEALTEWKWLSLAHTKSLAFGLNQAKIVTQKTLMVQPGLPRFLREGDRLELSARISNLYDSALTGTVTLQLFDALTNQPVDGLFQSVFPDQYFTVDAKQGTVVKFPVTIPFNFNKPLTIKIVARAKLPVSTATSNSEFADGEENTLPVLTNRMLVTETLPLYMRGEGAREFKFEKLLNNNSATLTNESITVEYTPQPVWYAVQALPYLMEYPHECAEQVFNRFYANALAAYIVSKHPAIKAVFETWKNDTTALLSNLEKNQELKQVLLSETPWVLDATNEAQQKKNIALLFDVAGMSTAMEKSLHQLQEMQMDNGAFPWFKGGYSDRYITQYILTGIGKLKKLGSVSNAAIAILQQVETKALQYTDLEIQKDKSRIKAKELINDHLGSIQIQYLYMRSFFPGIKAGEGITAAQNYYLGQSKKYWLKQTNYLKAMIAAALYRNNEQAFADKNIIPSIFENAVTDSIKGMYWKNNVWGYYWHQSPIEQQALMIELLHEMVQQKENDEVSTHISDMQTWLLLNKQTNNWKTTKATADACYALLIAGNPVMNAQPAVTIKLGNYDVKTLEQQQAGTGYIKERIDGKTVTSSMGNIYVGVSNPVGKSAVSLPSWGAVYWQYFEDLDKITPAQTPLSLKKNLFIEKNSAAGKLLQPVNDGASLHIGDKLIVQVTLKSDRDMEYLHLKDMRAAAMEPVNALSNYKWQDGLGYYESTKDASTDFFISYLPKGTYVFEYPVYITHTGNFSAGIANIQCMYAPEFSAHSQGIKVTVENAAP